MKDHLQSGGKDSRGTNIDELVKAGVPLERARAKSSTTRPDVAWANSKSHAFELERPDASSEEMAAKRRELCSQWKEAHGQVVDTSRVDADGDEDVCLPPLLSDEDDLFWAGDVEWGVRESVLAAVFDPVGGKLPEGMGLARKAHKLRQESLSQLVVQDVHDIPDSRVFEHRFSCSQLHFGLCATRDNLIYSDALALAGSVERCLGKALQGKVIGFYANPEDTEDSPAHPHAWLVTSRPCFASCTRVAIERQCTSH